MNWRDVGNHLLIKHIKFCLSLNFVSIFSLWWLLFFNFIWEHGVILRDSLKWLSFNTIFYVWRLHNCMISSKFAYKVLDHRMRRWQWIINLMDFSRRLINSSVLLISCGVSCKIRVRHYSGPQLLIWAETSLSFKTLCNKGPCFLPIWCLNFTPIRPVRIYWLLVIHSWKINWLWFISCWLKLLLHYLRKKTTAGETS